MRGTNETSKAHNAYIDALERKVHDARLKLLESSKTVTADRIIMIITGQEEKPRMLLDIFQNHNDQLSKLKDIQFAPATIKRYETTIGHTRNFILWKYGAPDIAIKDLGFDFISDMEFWFKSIRKCNHNSTIKYLGNLRKIVNYCLYSPSYHPRQGSKVFLYFSANTITSLT